MTETSDTDTNGTISKKRGADASASSDDVPPSSQDQRSKTGNKKQPAVVPAAVSEEVTAEGSDQRVQLATTADENEEDRGLRQSPETDKRAVKEADSERFAAPEPNDSKELSADYEERKKHERRRRRCPIVEIERYLNNGENEEEGKEEGRTTRQQRSLARTIVQEDITGFSRLVQEEGTRVSDYDGHGWTPLHWACSRGSAVMTYAVLQEIRLSQAAADSGSERVDEPDPLDCLNLPERLNGWTALHLAAIGGHLKVVYQLMEAGCDPQVKDRMGDRPVNCIKRTTRKPGGVAERLRNALLDLSDTEDSTCGESTVPRREGDTVRTTGGATRPLPRRGCKRERNMHR